MSDIEYAAGVVWSCDAEAALRKKARDIRRHLAEATEQLPANRPGVVHVGLESLDGTLVEEKRYRRVADTVLRFDARGKDLHWIYVYVFDPIVPPDKNWDFGETVYYFNKTNSLPEPLCWRPVVLSSDAEMADSPVWT
jgi:hypothetical protein